MKLAFVYLTSFSKIGGIEKFNKCFMRALSHICEEKRIVFNAISLYDSKNDNRYINSCNFIGAASGRLSFIRHVISTCISCKLIILGHINLYPIGLFFKLFGKKIILITHGIEVWSRLTYLKSLLLRNTDIIVCVSDYTKDKILELESSVAHKINIIPNTIDPFFSNEPAEAVLIKIKSNYYITSDSKVLLAVSRMRYDDREKGYEKVIHAIADLKNKFGDLKYFIVGPIDDIERSRIEQMILDLGLSDNVYVLPNVTEDELSALYALSDIFVLPSKKEGFGIVYIESLYCGTPVIAGNQDGSQDALLNGKLGFLVDPDNSDELIKTISYLLSGKYRGDLTDPSYLKNTVTQKFGYDVFKNKVSEIIRHFE